MDKKHKEVHSNFCMNKLHHPFGSVNTKTEAQK